MSDCPECARLRKEIETYKAALRKGHNQACVDTLREADAAHEALEAAEARCAERELKCQEQERYITRLRSQRNKAEADLAAAKAVVEAAKEETERFHIEGPARHYVKDGKCGHPLCLTLAAYEAGKENQQ
jgi:multidrug resistance efflux pump